MAKATYGGPWCGWLRRLPRGRWVQVCEAATEKLALRLAEERRHRPPYSGWARAEYAAVRLGQRPPSAQRAG
jgi:hypothetical protein